jgi:tetratricopeptide (TPR) repeat protein
MSPVPIVRRFLVIVLPAIILVPASSAYGQSASEKKYPFANPPLKILDQLAGSGVAKPDPLSKADSGFLDDLWAARSANKSLPPADDAAVTAHLIASGVENSAARAAYLKKFNALVEAAKKAVGGTKTDGEKADQLLRFLHKEVMAKGYSSEQTRLSAVFDTGEYNCVSSACLYYLVGTRLGLKLQPVLTPGEDFVAGHAAVDLLTDGKRIEIEPTNPDGYNFPEKLKQPGVRAVGPQPDRSKAHDCDGFGLAGSIASNRGVAAGKSHPPRPVESVRAGLIALVLDPTNDSASKNLLAAVSNWGYALDKEKKLAEALKVFEFGRAALGKHQKLDDNHKVVWEHHLVALFSDGKFADGLKELPRAAAAFPHVEGFNNPAEWVERAAAARAKADGWAKGLEYADSAVKELTGKPADAIRAWKTGARRNWSQDLLKKGDVDGSLKIIAAGLGAAPDDKELLDGLAYHTQEAIRFLDAKKGTDKAIAHFQEIIKAYPKVQDVRDMALTHAHSAVGKLEKAKKFPEALKAAATYAPLAGDRAADLACSVYDAWARSFAKDGKWEEAIKKYAEGLAAYPKNELLTGNGVITVDQWGVKAINEKKPKVAIERYEFGIKHLGEHKQFSERIEYCQKKLEK